MLIFRKASPLALAVVCLVTTAPARADIPADYQGTPYLGTPSVIPGRVELTNVDLGGEGVAYHADHRRSNSAGYEPISGNDYRPGDKDLPNICKTNGANPDYWADDDTLYPSAAAPSSYYIGYAHAVDWVKVTVDVKYAGTYNVSSNWASEGPKWALSIWFNDGKSAVDAARPKDGENKSGLIEMDGTGDYHKWKAYPNFAKVQLSAGLQVMTFHLEKYDHLQYGFLQFDLEGGVPGTGGAGAGGAVGSGGAGGVGTGGAATGGASTGGVASAGSATVGMAGAAQGGAPSGIAVGGSAGALGATPADSAADDGGCSLSQGSRSQSSLFAGLLFGAALLVRRRRYFV